jgi:hypothetical protein
MARTHKVRTADGEILNEGHQKHCATRLDGAAVAEQWRLGGEC